MAQLLLHDIPLKDEFSFGPCSGAELYRANFYAFNTSIELKLGGLNEADAKVAALRVVEQCRYYERLLSRTLSGSQIVRINESLGDYIEISGEVYKALSLGKYYSRKSEGAFDITVGALTRLYDFSAGRFPNEKDLEEALRHVDCEKLKLSTIGSGNDAHYFVQLEDPKVALDLGGFAKGYIADCLRDELVSKGIQNSYISLGGNIVVYGGKPEGRPWTIGVRNPFGQDLLGAFSLYEGSVVTSGTYERCFTTDDTSYHHILDPSTGKPAQTDIASITLITKSSTMGDGYSTTLLLWGLERAYAFVESTHGMEAIFVKSDGTIVLSQNAQLSTVSG